MQTTISQSVAPLRGKIILEFVDTRDGSKRVIENDNIITNAFYNNNNYGRLTNPSGNTGIRTFYNASAYIFLSTNSNPASRTTVNASEIPTIVAGAPSSTYSVNIAALPYFAQIYYQFPAPGGSGRSFQTVGLVSQPNLNSSNVQPNTYVVYAYTVLPTVCTQGQFEFLNAYYVLQPGIESTRNAGFPGDKQVKANAHFLNVFGNNQVSVAWSGQPYLSTVLLEEEVMGYPNQSTYPYKYPRISPRANNYQGPQLGSAINRAPLTTLAADLTRYAAVSNVSCPEGRLVGKIFNGYHQGAEIYFNVSPFGFGNFNFPESNGGLQGLFTHNSTATGPFFDGANSANGTGGVSVTGTWASGKWPQIYGINITSNGAVGTSEYNFWTAPTTGFVENSYFQRTPLCTYINNHTPAFDGAHGHNLAASTTITKYSETSVVTWDSTGVTLLNVSNGEYKFWDQTSSPALSLSNIAFCCTNGAATNQYDYTASTLIYVADKTAGLLVIDPTANTVTNLIATPCYAVACATGGNVVAVLSTGVVYGNVGTFTSPAPLTISSTVIDYNTVAYIKTDKASPTYQSAIVLTAGEGQIYWFNNTTAGALTYCTGFPSTRRAKTRSLGSIEVSDYNSYWVAGLGQGPSGGNGDAALYKLTPQTTASSLVGNLATAPGVVFVGDKVIGFSNTYIPGYSVSSGSYYDDEPNFGTYQQECRLIELSNNSVAGYTTYDLPTISQNINNYDAYGKCFMLHMSAGLMLVGAYELLSYQPYYSGFAPKENYNVYLAAPSLTTPLWKRQYKWDTTTSLWGTGFSSNKPTHTSADTLIHGFNTSFINGSTGTSFVANDYYTFTACRGLMKDNATTFSAQSKVYVKPAYYNMALEGGLVVGGSPISPAITSDPEFVILLNDYATNFSINLNGSPALVLLTGSPGPGQVTVGTNTLTFNAADTGASITGTISYLKHV